MKTSKLIITAGAILALAAPAGNAAVSNIPTDGGYITGPRGTERTALLKVSSTQKVSKRDMHDARIRLGGGSSHYAYVPGGSSAKVAQAIVDAGERMGSR